MVPIMPALRKRAEKNFCEENKTEKQTTNEEMIVLW